MSASSATAATSMVIVPVVCAVSPPFDSVDVAVTPRSNVPAKSSGGVIVRLSISVGSFARSSAEIVHVPSPLSVPADRTAPSGTPVIVIDRLSEPSVSVSAALISSEMAVSSEPLATPVRSSVGVSASASTCTKSSTGSSSSPRTDNVKSTSEFAGGVIVRLSKSVTV